MLALFGAFSARALAQNAELYLMDEPFAGVDAASEQVLISALRDLPAINLSL